MSQPRLAGNSVVPSRPSVTSCQRSSGEVIPPGYYTYFGVMPLSVQRTYWRQMVIIRNVYVRHQPYPLKEADALALGLVVQGPSLPTAARACEPVGCR